MEKTNPISFCINASVTFLLRPSQRGQPVLKGQTAFVKHEGTGNRNRLGTFNLILGTRHLKRVIRNANEKSPLIEDKQDKGFLEASVLSSGVGNAALIMLKGRFKKDWKAGSPG